MLREFLFGLTLLPICGCCGMPGPSNDIVAEVTRATLRFRQAERTLDAEALLGFLSPDFYMYQDGKRGSYETTKSQIRTSIPSLRKFETTWSDLEVLVMGPESACVSFTFHDVITDGEGTTTRAKGATTLLWKRGVDGWRIVYADADHYPVTGG